MNSKLISFLLAAASYYFLGVAGLTLAIPPGFASAVWPASGAALFLMIFANRPAVLAGTWVGSFALNLGINTNFYEHMSWAAAFPGVIIAFGAIIQASFGYYLFKRFIGETVLPDTQHKVIRFLAIVAPIGCLVAPTVAVNTLTQLGIISTQNFWFSWVTWWAGDTLGVLLFTPLLLALASPVTEVSPDRKIQICLPILLIFVSVLMLFFKSLSVQNYAAAKDIEESAGRVVTLISERLKRVKETLLAYDAYFSGSEFVSRAEYHEFSEILLEDNTVFQGVGWTQIVPKHERELYESTAQIDGFDSFKFTELDSTGALFPAPEREEYYPVLYIYPYVSNERALGLNLAAIPSRLQALKQARASKRAVATEPTKLAQESENKLALIMYHPVFDRTISTKTEVGQSSADNFRGYVSGVIKLSGILDQLDGPLSQQSLGLTITDSTDRSNPKELINVGQQAFEHFKPVYSSLKFGGRDLTVSVYATKEYQLSSKDWTSWTILTGGILIAAILQGLILIITGGTELIKLEVESKTSELTRTMKRLELADAAKSNFTSTMSHEIRTPLNGVIGLLNQCLKTKLTEQQHYYLSQAKLASDTLLSLVNLILDFSKIESGKLELEEADFCLLNIVNKMRAIFTELAGQKKIGFDLVLPETLPSILVGDALRIEQVLLNLCGNAVKFTEKGGVTLQVSLGAETSKITPVMFTVTDSGIGIPQDKIATLFDSYQQADNSTSRRFGGTGLGLTITKRLVNLMGGEITVISKEGEGAQFCFQVNLKRANGSVDVATKDAQLNHVDCSNMNEQDIDGSYECDTEELTGLEHDHHKELSGVHILVVEDVAINQLIAKEILQEHGAHVTLADNGVMALDELQSAEFDLVLMDIHMPEKDGYETTKLIRRLPQHHELPIIAMTANVMSSDVQKALDAGMNDHIAKPVDEQIMVAKIKAFLAT